jgi:pyridinium-3,5-bisthiocarboxylic acid mononucleotide nickel chelatase
VTRLLYVDVVGGAAGDMLLAALLDAGVPAQPVWEAVDAVLPGRFACRIESVLRAGMRAALLHIDPGPAAPAMSAASGADLEPRALSDLLAAVDRAPLHPRVAAAAKAVLERLGHAEGRVHGSTGADSTLHALGDDDTLLDVVGVAAALHAAEIDRALISAVPIESEGWLPPWGGHPEVPLPAPVTLELLRGFRTRPGGSGEVVTPTAAAIFAALASPAEGFPDTTIDAIGYGAGTRDPADRPNVVRVVLGSQASVATTTKPSTHEDLAVRHLVVMEANLDDLTPELIADAVQALLSAGALDVWTTPAQMKKGRPGVVLSVLCEADAEDRLRSVFFETTSTFGVRSYHVGRAELKRRTVSVDLSDGSVRVKVGLLGGRVVSATPEHDDVASVAARAGRPVRHVYSEAAAAARTAWLAPSEG